MPATFKHIAIMVQSLAAIEGVLIHVITAWYQTEERPQQVFKLNVNKLLNQCKRRKVQVNYGAITALNAFFPTIQG